MHFQFEVVPTPRPNSTAPAPLEQPIQREMVDLLRQILEVQREILQLQKQAIAAADQTYRWRGLLHRWQHDFPRVGTDCRAVLPALERALLTLVHDLTTHLQEQDIDRLENDFALTELLDRFGIRLGQLSTILSSVTPLAEAANSGEISS